jgi:hypothetical protein
MRHGRARRLIPALPDATLPEMQELELRVHVVSCARCRRQVREMELAEALLRRLPVSLLPAEESRASAARLASLARWSPDPYAPEPGRWRFPALGLAGMLGMMLLAITLGSGVPVRGDTPDQVLLASLYPESSAYLPVGWSGGSHF